MDKKQIVTSEAPVPRAAYSQGILKGGVLATVQIGDDPSGRISDDVGDQVTQTLMNIAAVLKAGGASWHDVIKATCYLADPNDFPVFDQVYRSFVPDPKPARSTVTVNLKEGIRVEIEVIAIISSTAEASQRRRPSDANDQ